MGNKKYINLFHSLIVKIESWDGLNQENIFSEEDPVNHPVSLYAATKRANELMAHVYSNMYALPMTGLRFFTVYGPWGRPDMALFHFTKSIIEGSSIEVPLHDGSLLSLEKLSEEYDPQDKISAIKSIQESQRDNKVTTGLLYVNPDAKDLKEILNVSDTPLNTMGSKDLCPGSENLSDINLSLK